MAECEKQMLQQNPFSIGLYGDYAKKNSWVIMKDHHDDHDDTRNSSTSTSSIGEYSTSSNRSSSSSSDLVDDATSSPSSMHSNGPLFELSEIMARLPIKRGLSKYFQGKSQSFTSLSKVRSIEDLPKKENPYNRRKMKACNSYGGGLDTHKSYYAPPKATISKRVSRGSVSSSSLTNRRSGGFLCNNRLPPLPVQKNF